MSALPVSLPSRARVGRDRGLDRTAERTVFNACVAELPDLFTPRERELARVCYVDSLSVTDAARVLGLARGTIGPTLTRIRRILNRWLARKAVA